MSRWRWPHSWIEFPNMADTIWSVGATGGIVQLPGTAHGLSREYVSTQHVRGSNFMLWSWATCDSFLVYPRNSEIKLYCTTQSHSNVCVPNTAIISLDSCSYLTSLRSSNFSGRSRIASNGLTRSSTPPSWMYCWQGKVTISRNQMWGTFCHPLWTAYLLNSNPTENIMLLEVKGKWTGSKTLQ